MSSTSSDISIISDSEDIVVDGFPPEGANNTRFVSLKSSSLTNQNSLRPISSWNADLPSDIIETCVKILKEPSKIPPNELKNFIEELETELNHRCENMNIEHDWHFKSVLNNSFPSQLKNDLNKSSIRVNIELPSTNINSNNVKYNLNNPVYDQEKQCWKVGMDFVLVNDHQVNVISEEPNTELRKDQETQTEENIFNKSSSHLRSPGSMSLSKSRSEEILTFLQSDFVECLEAQVETSVDYLALENIEKAFKSFNEKSSIKSIQSSFKNYKSLIQSNIGRYQKEIRSVKQEAESKVHVNYTNLTETQFKIYSKNQLLLTDVEKQISLLILQLNSINKEMKNIYRNSDKNVVLDSVNELKKCQFSSSLRLISQMVNNLKKEVRALNKEMFGSNRQKK